GGCRRDADSRAQGGEDSDRLVEHHRAQATPFGGTLFGNAFLLQDDVVVHASLLSRKGGIIPRVVNNPEHSPTALARRRGGGWATRSTFALRQQGARTRPFNDAGCGDAGRYSRLSPNPRIPGHGTSNGSSIDRATRRHGGTHRPPARAR